jgi:hypothetical protein
MRFIYVSTFIFIYLNIYIKKSIAKMTTLSFASLFLNYNTINKKEQREYYFKTE